MTLAAAPERSPIGRLLGLAWQYRWGCLKVLSLQAGMLALSIAAVALTGLGIDELRHALDASAPAPRWRFVHPPAGWTPLRIIIALALGVFLCGLIRAVLDYAYRLAAERLVQVELVVHLRRQIYDKLQRLSFRFYDANASSSLINRVTGDVQGVRMFVDQVLLQAIVLVFSIGTYLAYMVSLHVPLTLACLASTPLMAFLAIRFSRQVQPAYLESRMRGDALVQCLAEAVKGMPVIKGFAREEEEQERFARLNEAVYSQKLGIFRKISLFTPTVGFLSQFNLAVLLGYGGYLVAKGELPLGAGLVAFATILQQFATQISNLSTITNSLQDSLSAAQRVFEVVDTPVGIRNRPHAIRLPKAKGLVRFEGVWFDHGTDPVLKDISFEVRPGQCVAVFGPTGSGKSLLMSLIPRFYDPTGGRVTLDGHDLRDLELDDLRHNVGMVFQESFLFSSSVAENIAFGHPKATRAQIERAARVAAAHDFIQALPKGYDTVLGEGGLNLSGGQRQRLAIARAVLLEPSLLLLDDPTAALDPGTEHEIAEALDSAMKERTTFLVAHRLSLLRRADLILVLDDGRLVQAGTHEALCREPGPYADAMQTARPAAPGEAAR